MAEFSGKELIQGEPDASSFPTGGIRATFEARGYTAWDPTSPAFILENPNGTTLCIPTAFASWTGEALDKKIPLLRSMDALSEAALRALRLLGDHESQRVFTTVGPEQEYFLIDEQYYFERPDLRHHRAHAVRRQAAEGARARRSLLRLDPRAHPGLHARERGRAGQARRAGQDPPQRGRAEPVRDRAGLRGHQRRLRPPDADDAGAPEHGPALRAGLPAARKALRRRQRLGQAQQLVDGHRHRQQPARAGRHAAREPVVPALLHGGHRGGRHPSQLLRASIASIGQDHRLGANEAPPAIISIFLGSELEEIFSAIADGKAQHLQAGRRSSGSARRCCRRSRCTPAIATAPARSRSPATSSSSAHSARASRSSFPNTVLNTIVADAIDELAEKLEGALKGGASLEKAIRGSSGTPDKTTGGSSSTATTTPSRGTRRRRSAVWRTCARRQTRCRG